MAQLVPRVPDETEISRRRTIGTSELEGIETSVSPVSPELALVDPVLADSERERIASRLDEWLARTEWRAPAPAEPSVRQFALAAALLVSILVNGFLTSYFLVGRHNGPTLQPAVPPPTQSASVLNEGAQKVIEVTPPDPAELPRTRSK